MKRPYWPSNKALQGESKRRRTSARSFNEVAFIVKVDDKGYFLRPNEKSVECEGPIMRSTYRKLVEIPLSLR